MGSPAKAEPPTRSAAITIPTIHAFFMSLPSCEFPCQADPHETRSQGTLGARMVSLPVEESMAKWDDVRAGEQTAAGSEQQAGRSGASGNRGDGNQSRRAP